MNNQKILDNAPDGATHVDSESDYYKINENVTEVMLNSLWFNAEDALMLPDDIRSLSDIKRIVELEKDKAFLLTQRFMGNMIVSTDQGLSDAIKANNLEQQAKGIEDFIEPYATRGSFGQVVYDSGLKKAFTLRNQAKQLREQAKGGA